MDLIDEPITRKERFLAGIAGSGEDLPEPVTREERYLAYIARNGTAGGIPDSDSAVSPEEAKEIFDNADPTPNGGSPGDVITPEEAKEIFDNANRNRAG